MRHEEKRKNCPSHGCVLLPRDIFYDKSSQDALKVLRDAAKKDQLTLPDHDAALMELIMSGDNDMATLTLIGYKGGDAASQINQDRAFVISPYYLNTKDMVKKDDDLLTQRLIGVFDGHARLGERVSEYATQQLPVMLADQLTKRLTPSLDKEARTKTVKECLEDTFIQVDQTAPAHPSGGCTATVMLQLGPQLFVANAGDSQSFVCVHKASTNVTQVVYISREDKPELPDERARVERMGGQVYIPTRPGASSRVIYYDSSTGSQSGLAMSRSLGDWDAGRLGVIPNPIVDVVDLQELVETHRWSDKEDDVSIFAVSASDGMMDFVSPDTIAQVLVPSLFDKEGEHPLTACERLISMAAAGWQRAKDGKYRDDIAISVTKLRTSPKHKEKNDEL